MDLPLKSELLKSFEDKHEQWEYDAIGDLMTENSLSSDYWKYNARFWLMELQSCGLVEPCEQEVDDGSHFAKGRILTKYRVTQGGLDRIEGMLE